LKPSHWAQVLGQSVDDVLLSSEAIDKLNQRNQQRAGGFQDVLGSEIGNQERVSKELDERRDWLAGRIDSGQFVEQKQGAFKRAQERINQARQLDEFRIVYQEATLYCIPMESGLFTAPIDPAFNRNRCSGLHPTEVVRVLRAGEDGWLYVHAGHSVGWINNVGLTPAIKPEVVLKYRDHPKRLVALADDVQLAGGLKLRMGSSIPLVAELKSGYRVQVPQASGLQTIDIQSNAGMRVGFMPMTRRNVLSILFSVLDKPYGWGGTDGGRDCSRFVLDAFAVFGLKLGRHSAEQSRSGIRSIDLADMNSKQKLLTIRSAAENGVLLLYMSGHIMVYLSESDGRSYAISSISEYIRPCGLKREQVVRLNRVAVTDLELGKATTRHSFLDRLTRLAVFSK